MVCTWLTILAVLRSNTPAGALAYADTVDNHTLLGLVTHAASLIWAGWMCKADKLWKLAVFPAAKAEDEAHNFTLLLCVELTEICKSTHEKRKG